MSFIYKDGIIYGGDNGVVMSSSEFEKLSQEEKNDGTTYYIPDGNASNPNGIRLTASNILLNGSIVGLAASNVQKAIVVIYSNFSSEIAALQSNFSTATNKIGNALVAKGIYVPEGTSLLEIANIKIIITGNWRNEGFGLVRSRENSAGI